MERHNEQGGGEQAAGKPEEGHDETHEKDRLYPKIWVGSLSDYNAGRLHGAWIDAGGDLDDLERGVEDMLKASPTPGADEFAVFDHEDFGPLHIGEYDSLANINRIARGIVEHGEAFAHYAALVGTSDVETLDHFDDVFLGQFDSVAAYAEEILDDLGLFDWIESSVPDSIAPYVRLDVESYARDLEMSGTLLISNGSAGVFIFLEG